MLRIERQAAAWSVLRDRTPVKEDGTSGVHGTFHSAVRQVMRLATTHGEHVLPIQWHRKHSNGWITTVSLNEDGELAWGAYPSGGGGAFTPATDPEEAELEADRVVGVRAGDAHVCSVSCGRWT